MSTTRTAGPAHCTSCGLRISSVLRTDGLCLSCKRAAPPANPCEGCDSTILGEDGQPLPTRLYLATTRGPAWEAYFCEECAAQWQGADMGASGCEAQGTLAPTVDTFRRGDIVRDIYGQEHEVMEAQGCAVHVYGRSSWFHPTKLTLVRGADAEIVLPAEATAIILGALARKRADRVREAELDAQSRAARA